jgi:hypothetical protein
LARSWIGTLDRGFEKIYRLVVDFILNVEIIDAVAIAAEGIPIAHGISILQVGIMSGVFIPDGILNVFFEVFLIHECSSRSEQVNFIRKES